MLFGLQNVDLAFDSESYIRAYLIELGSMGESQQSTLLQNQLLATLQAEQSFRKLSETAELVETISDLNLRLSNQIPTLEFEFVLNL